MKERVIVSNKFLYYSMLGIPLLPVIISSIGSIYFYETNDSIGIIFSGLVWTVFILLFIGSLRKSIHLEITENDTLKFGNVFFEQEVHFQMLSMLRRARTRFF